MRSMVFKYHGPRGFSWKFSPRQREWAARSGENQSLRGQEEKNEVFLFLPARDSISAPWLRAARSFSAEKNFKKNLWDRGSIVQETSLKKFQWVIYRIRVCFEYMPTNFKLTNQCVFPIFPHVRVTLWYLSLSFPAKPKKFSSWNLKLKSWVPFKRMFF